MRRVLIIVFFLNLFNVANAQEIKLQKSILGIQVGLGAWIYNETRVNSHLVLRSDVGLQNEIILGGVYQKFIYIKPVFSIEPKWYYNIEKRKTSGKNILSNSANFLSLKMELLPDWFVLSSNKEASELNSFSIIPTWGIRRILAKKFNFEAGVGVGYKYLFSSEYNNSNNIAIKVHLRIGLDFTK